MKNKKYLIPEISALNIISTARKVEDGYDFYFDSTTIPNEYLTKNSTQFHEHMGYKTVGEFRKCGYKFGRWYNMVWMEKIIGEHTQM